jgi:hypothetical protein
VLAEENRRRVERGEPVEEVERDAVAAAERVFGRLEGALPLGMGGEVPPERS